MLLSLILSAGLNSSVLLGNVEDSHVDTLHAVTVMADKGVVVSRTDTLSFSNSLTAADALQLSPGIHLGDNGGFSGLKTISLRGMGSAGTAIYVDGVRLGNVQSGQNDISILGLDGFSSAYVDYAQNSVNFNTATPVFTDSPFAGNIRLSAGSFASWLPSMRLDFRLSKKLSLSAHASGVFSKGDYPYGEGEVRTNNDIKQGRAGLDLFGKISEGKYHIKAYFNSAERGAPGSIYWLSEDRQKDMNTFLQGTMTKRFTPLYVLRLSSKISYDDIAYSSSWGDSEYGQTEFQLNSAHEFQVRRWLKLSLAADVQWDGLKSSVYDASRFTAFSAVASSFRLDRFSADLALEYSGAFDIDAQARSAFSPSMGLKYKVLNGFDISAFARRSYRVPTFNELYYVGYGNPLLRPENAWLTNISLDFFRALSSFWKVKAKADTYCNFLTDKIVSAPTAEDPNIWMPYNIGKVRSTGIDFIAGIAHEGEWRYAIDAKWTFQSAIDLTDGADTYGQQIPYIARHTFVVDGSLQWKGWSLIPLWQMRAGRTDGMGELSNWNTFDLSLCKNMMFGKTGSLTAKLMSKNIFDNRYEIVSGYPMPGRSFLVGIEYMF